eukprot:TRINITY_DN5920_c0_g1_i1.p1 TRINITY_DN5920_c0_g1~~TRINITY_DN5920_c0_g1_i1.p1  ORF type:complete len:682 (-),score=165.33 TRINITY_DN5920_c0_g1_i1:7-2052(-)
MAPGLKKRAAVFAPHHEVQSVDPFYEQELPVAGLAAACSTIIQDSEVERFIAQDHLSPGDRAVYLLEHGSMLQKCSVVEGLQRMAAGPGTSDVARVLAGMTELLWQCEDEVQTAASMGVLQALLEFSEVHLVQLFPLVKTMACLRVDAARERWRPTLVAYAARCPPHPGRLHAVGTGANGPSEPQDVRQGACEVLGALFPQLPSAVKEGPLLQKVLALCQDTDYNVRLTMCRQLDPIARALSPQRAEQAIAKELFDLLDDEEIAVFQAAFSALIDLLDLLPQSVRRDRALPLVHRVLSRPADASPSVLRAFGKCLCQLAGDLGREEDFRPFVSFFEHCVRCRDAAGTDSRVLCAYNFPAVVHGLGARRYLSALPSVLKDLSEDPCPEVRRRVAAGFHEVCAILQDKALPHVLEPFFSMAADAAQEVRDALFGNLGAILRGFHACGLADRRLLSDVAGAITAYEAAVQPVWRKVLVLLQQFDVFPLLFPSDLLHDLFPPIVFHHLAQGTVDIKEKAAELLAAFTRRLGDPAQQLAVLNQIILDFGQSPSYWHRLTYITCCLRFLEHFSHRVFWEKLLELVLDLTMDPVSNVRLRVCLLIPPVKRLRWTTESADLATVFDEKVALLSADPDRDVREAAARGLRRMTDLHRDAQRRRRASRAEDPEDRAAAEREVGRTGPTTLT